MCVYISMYSIWIRYVYVPRAHTTSISCLLLEIQYYSLYVQHILHVSPVSCISCRKQSF